VKKARLKIDKDYQIGNVDDKLFSSFIEHLGRAVYSGIYEPGHPEADEFGFRKDVIDLVRELNISLIRYPGGNFVSGYRWADGIGPKDMRPKRLDLAWHSIETNAFGIDEFVDWSSIAGTGIMAAVNLGTGTPQDAADLVEYCNHPSGTYLSDLRGENGHKNPHDIRYWCLGNEMDGPWQIGHLKADEYGRKAAEAAKMMRLVDPSIHLIACGSSLQSLPTFPEWDRIVLEHLYDNVDYLSMHSYFSPSGDQTSYFASFIRMDNIINQVISTMDYVKSVKRSKKEMMISFDEWNIWYHETESSKEWITAPSLLEDRYSFCDALAFCGLICVLLNHADRVKIACLAQLVNVIAPILTENGGRAIRQTIFYPFLHASLYGRGSVLKTITDAPKIETHDYGEVSSLYTACTFNEATNEISIFALNINCDDIALSVDFTSFGHITPIEHIEMSKALDAVNTFENSDFVKPTYKKVEKQDNIPAEILLSAHSWNVIRFSYRL